MNGTRLGWIAGSALLAVGCGGGGDGVETAAPTAAVFFPPDAVLAERGSVTVRGTATDATGVAAVRVNGLAATSSNGFADWEITITPQLTSGREKLQLTVETEDVLGNVEADAARVRVEFRRHVFGDVSGVDFDPGRGLALVMDSLPSRVVTVDPISGQLTPILNPNPVGLPDIPQAGVIAYHPGLDEVLVAERTLDDLFGIHVGTAWQRLISLSTAGNDDLTGIVVDTFGNRVLVLDNRPRQPRVIEVDVASGARTILSGSANTGPLLKGGGGLALDYNGNRVLATVWQSPGVIGVDLTSGDRTLVSGTALGFGPPFVAPSAVAVDPALGLAYVTDRGARAVFAVDLATGDRSIVSDAALGTGPSLLEPVAVVLDPGNRLLVADAGHDALLLVDPVSGDRTAFPAAGIGDGVKLSDPTGVAKLRTPGGSYLITDTDLDAVVAIDPLTRDRAILSDATTGSGAVLFDPADIEIESPIQSLSPERVFVLDTELRALYLVDPASGDRTVVSDDVTGSGVLLALPVSFALDASVQTAGVASCAYVLDAPPQTTPTIVRVDLATGNRTEISGPGAGGGRFMAGATSLGYDAYANPPRLLVLDPYLDSLLAVDLASGVRTIVSPPSFLGYGPPFGLGPTDIRRDPTNNRAIVVDTAAKRIVAVNLDTGMRTSLTDPPLGSGWEGEPTALLLDAGFDRAVAVDRRATALFSVDLRNGGRVMLSK